MASEDILRVNYTEGQFLGAADFTAEQTYMDQSRRRHYIGEHTWGIVSNLQIVQNTTSNVWVVTAGMAIDGYGREISLFQDEPLDTAEIAAQLAGQNNATLQIWIAYNTETTAPAVNGYASCMSGASNTRIRESFQLIYQDNPPPFDQLDPENRKKWPVAWQDLPDDAMAQPWPVFLGTIYWDGSAGAITKVTTPPDCPRHYAGLLGVEVYSQTDQFDVRAILRVRAEATQPATITTSGDPNVNHDLNLFSNDSKGGANVRIDKDDLHVGQKIVVNGTIGDGTGKLHLETDNNDLAILTRPVNGPGTRNLAIRTNDGAGGNQILLDKDDVTALSLTATNSIATQTLSAQSITAKDLVTQTLTASGAALLKGGLELWGGQLLLKLPDGTDDTDRMAISRFNNAPDRNDFRIQIGDNIGGDDRFVVGPVYFADGQFKEQFVVDNQGTVKTAGSVNGRAMAADGLKLDGISPGATQTAVLTGVLFNGGTIPLPAGYTEAQCRWIVSPFEVVALTNYTTQFICGTPVGRIVKAQWTTPGPTTVSGWANYLIIGVK